MKKQVLSALALVILAFACAGEAAAAVQRTFVSGLGSDASVCSRTEPCRTFAAAIAQTLPGGEVLALDTAGYGPVTIDKAISLISPPGVYAGITTTTGGVNGINIAVGSSEVVVLKGLSLSGLGLGNDGVSFSSGKALRVEGLTISGFTGNGIAFNTQLTARLSVADSLIRDNGQNGILAASPVSNEFARATVDRTRLIGNANGLLALGSSRINARDTVASGNSGNGFYVSSLAASMNLENCLATDNGFGLWSGGLMRAAGTTVTDNETGVFGFTGGGGSVLSRVNNTVEGNGTDGTFTGTFVAK